jgi:hypothetical protein
MAAPAAWDTNLLILFSEMLTFSPQTQTQKNPQKNIFFGRKKKKIRFFIF